MRDLYQTVTDRIVASLEAGTVPWVKPWNVSGANRPPFNVTTGIAYRGVNFFLLGMGTNYEYPGFLTFKQAKDHGGTVRRGEHGHKIYFFKPWTTTDKKTGEDKKILLLKEFTVFNVSQCDNLPEKYYGPKAEPVEHTDSVNEAFGICVKNTKAVINHGGDKAFFSPSGNFVQMPELNRFHSVANYEATLAHELIHWTGHESRLNRDFRGRFDKRAYAAEELVAEMGAAFVCAKFGIEGDLRHASYIQSWIELLTEDKRAIFTAASKAQQATDFLLGMSKEEESEEGTQTVTEELVAA